MLFQSRTVKIALAVFLVVVLALAAYFYFGKNKEEDSATEGAGTIDSDEVPRSGSLPGNTGSTGAGTRTTAITPALPSKSQVATSPTASPTITPYPGSGAFDWTRNKTPEPLDIELTTEQVQKLQSGDTCEIAGISDSWSKPVEKISCGLTRYFEEQIIVPLQMMACNFMGAAISTNYKSGVEAKLDGNTCKLIDR